MIKQTLALLTFVAIAAPASAEASIVGTWRLVSFDREIVATKEVVKAFGGHATGFATYTADGRYSSLLIDSTRPSRPISWRLIPKRSACIAR